MQKVFLITKKKCRAILACAFLIACYSGASGHLLATCTCPDPVICPPQLNEPPYQPCTLITSANSYLLRYSVVGVRGAMTFVGNTLGLSKERCLNEPGTPGTVIDSIGAFTSVDSTQTVGSYANITSGVGGPAGTTLDWELNSSSALLNLPAGSTILHAELIWSGSFGYYCSDPTTGPGIGVDPNCVLDYAGGPIRFITPDGATHLVTADPSTALESQNPALDVQTYYCGGNYTRSQDVTALMIVLGDPNGTYTVGSVPATVSALDNSHNAAGWTLAVVYQDLSGAFVNNMSLFLGAQQASLADAVVPASMVGFCAQTTPGLISARLLVSAVEGDADIGGDQMKFGPTADNLTAISGPNNPIDNFFASQINDDDGNLISTTGTYCIYNQDPISGVLIPNGRQGYDITNIDVSSQISSGQTSAFALGTTTGDDYTINALGLQISVLSPTIVPIKHVNGVLSVEAEIGETVTFTVRMENTGTSDALDVIFQDTLESGLYFVPGSVTLNSVSMPSVNPESGISLGTIAIGDTDIIAFDVTIINTPPSGNVFVNKGSASFSYSACLADINTSNDSNLALITLSGDVRGPSDFIGRIKKCKTLNGTRYYLVATFVPAPPPEFVPYEIYLNGEEVAEIPPGGPYVYKTWLTSKKEASKYSVIGVYDGIDSIPLNIRIIHE